MQASTLPLLFLFVIINFCFFFFCFFANVECSSPRSLHCDTICANQMPTKPKVPSSNLPKIITPEKNPHTKKKDYFEFSAINNTIIIKYKTEERRPFSLSLSQPVVSFTIYFLCFLRLFYSSISIPLLKRERERNGKHSCVAGGNSRWNCGMDFNIFIPQRHPLASIFPATLGGSPCHHWDSSHLPDPGFIQLLQL